MSDTPTFVPPRAPTPFVVQVQVQGVSVCGRAMYAGGESALGNYPGTWTAVYCGPEERDGLDLALWVELPERLDETFGRDRDFHADMLRAVAFGALSRDWFDLRCMGFARWAGCWALTFTGRLVWSLRSETASCPSWTAPPFDCTYRLPCYDPRVCRMEGFCAASRQ